MTDNNSLPEQCWSQPSLPQRPFSDRAVGAESRRQPGSGNATIRRTVKAFFCWANIGLMDVIRYVNPESELGSAGNDGEKLNQAFEAGVRMVAWENDI